MALPTPPAFNAPAPLVALPWLVRLRWIAVSGQLLTIGIVQFGLGIPLPVAEMSAVVGVTVLSNLALDRWLKSPSPPSSALASAVLVLDTLLLTALLHLSGGPANPFTALYALHVTLAVVLLGSRWGWTILGLSCACYALLFLGNRDVIGLSIFGANTWRLHVRGMWLSFLVAGSVIAYFVGRISAELAASEQELAEVQAQIARNEKLASLSSLAAGAAHELGTPLATIAVIAKELERHAQQDSSSALAQDARLIREQCERCRAILVQMSAKAGETVGEMPGPIDIDRLLADVRAALAAERAVRLQIKRRTERTSLIAPRQALVLVLASLCRNAFDASPSDAPVSLEIAEEDASFTLTVRDRGHGMSADVLARAGDPFFSTKPPGLGTGLGLFLARTFAEGLGGRLTLHSDAGAGTTVTLDIPVERQARAA